MRLAASIVCRAAAFAVFLDEWWTSGMLAAGVDSRARTGKLVGMALAFGASTLFVERFVRPALDARRRWLLLSPLLLAWIPSVLAAPLLRALALVSDSGPDGIAGSPVLSTASVAIASAVLFLPLSIPLAGFARDASRNLPALAFGLVLGLLALEFYGLSLGGFRPCEAVALAVLCLAEVALASRENAAKPSPRPPLGLNLSLFAGLVAGALFALARLCLLSYLSGTRASDVALLAVFLGGVSVGALLASAFELSRRTLAPRVAILSFALIGAVLAAGLSLLPLASRGAPALAATLPAAQAEWLLVAMVASLPSVLLGLASGAVLSREGELASMGIGIAAGVLLLVPLLSDRLVGALSRQGFAGAALLERRVTPEGVLTRVQWVRGWPATLVHLNREPISRSPEWDSLAEAEILLPARLASVRPGGLAAALVVGTPFSAHRKAIADCGLSSFHVVDPVPAFLEGLEGVWPAPGADAFRFAAASPRRRYEAIVLLSRPFLRQGDGLALAREPLHRWSELLGPGGALYVWLDPRSLPASEMRMVVKTVFELFPRGRLWIAGDALAGPLFCLEGRPGDISQPGEPSWMPDLEDLPVGVAATAQELSHGVSSAPRNTLDHPRLELRLPLEPPRLGLPAPEALRSLARLLSPEGAGGTPAALLLEAAAEHSLAQIPQSSPFATRLERVTIPREEVRLLTLGLERFPEFEPIHRSLGSASRLLLEKTESDLLFEFGPRWVAARPDDPTFPYVLGRIHHELLDDGFAVPLLERAAAIEPESVEIQETLGEALNGVGRFHDAALAFTAALERKPGDEEGRLEREIGIAYFKAGEIEAARPFLAKATAKRPNDPEVASYLARARESGQ